MVREIILKKGQVWIETVIYTLIGLTIMAVLLSVAMPQIDKLKDRGVVTQTINALNDLDDEILEIQQTAGNIRIVHLKLSKGKLEIDAENDALVYTLEDTNLELSEVGVDIPERNLILKTEKYGKNFNIIIRADYGEYLNLTYAGMEESKVLQQGSVAYKLQLENVGSGVGERINVDFEVL